MKYETPYSANNHPRLWQSLSIIVQSCRGITILNTLLVRVGVQVGQELRMVKVVRMIRMFKVVDRASL